VLKKWGGKKERNSLVILQTFLLLNTFWARIKIKQLHKNLHYTPSNPYFGSDRSHPPLECNLGQRRNFLYVLNHGYNPKTP